MKVREIMTTGVRCIAPNTTIQEAAGEMKLLDVGFLPICQDDRLTGTVTDRDIAIRAVAEGREKNTSVAEIMTQDVFYCFDDEDIQACAAYMKEKEVRRVLILDRNKRLVGVVSIGDLSKVEGIQEVVGDTLKEIAEAA